MKNEATNMAAMSLTPSDFLTNAIIILSLPPSPESPESGTDIGGPGASTSATTSLGRSSAGGMVHPGPSEVMMRRCDDVIPQLVGLENDAWRSAPSKNCRTLKAATKTVQIWFKYN